MRKASPRLIGAFVLGAIVLLVGGVLTFGSGRFFEKSSTFVAFFDGSIKGLRVGAPVNFRGAPIGTVTAIDFIVNDDLSVELPVTFVIPQDRAARSPDDIDPREGIQRMIADGLRAQLESQSLVTGQLNIALDFFPDTPVELHPEDKFDPNVLEIPTIQSTKEEFTEAAGAVAQDLPELIATANTLLSELTDVIREDRGTIAQTLENVEAVTGALAGRIDPIVEDTASTMANLRSATNRLDGLLDETEGVLQGAGGTIQEIRGVVTENRDNLRSSFASLEDAAKSVEEILAENREAIKDFTNVTLFEVSGLITDTQQLVNTLNRVGEDLERDPARFFFGDQQQGFQGGQ